MHSQTYLRNRQPLILPVFIISAAVLVFALFTIITRIGFAKEMPEHLRLKSDKSQILDMRENSNGEVQYAYKSGRRVSAGPSLNVIKEAEKQGVQITGEDLSHRTIHSRTFRTTRADQFITEVISGVPQYYRDSGEEWHEVDYATTTKEAFDEQTRPNPISQIFISSALATTTTSSYWTSLDGGAAHEYGGDSFSALRGGSGTAADYTGSNAEIARLEAFSQSGKWNRMAVGIFLFDTSDIPTGNTISSATLSLYGQAVIDAFGQSVVLTNSNPVSTSSLSPTDYTNHVTNMATEVGQSRITLSSFSQSTTTPNNFAILNPDGVITKSGITKLGTRISADFDNLEPTWQSNGNATVQVYTSEQAGTANDPALVIVHYSIPPPPSIPTLTARKPSYELFHTTDLHTDDTLQLGLEANKTYKIDGAFYASSTSATPDLKFRFGGTTGAEADIMYSTVDVNGPLTGHLESNNGTTTTSSTIQLTTTPVIIHFTGTVKMGATQGPFRLQWGQATSDSNNYIYVGRGSYITAEPF